MSTIRFLVNGAPAEVDVPGMRRLLDVLREDLGQTSTVSVGPSGPGPPQHAGGTLRPTVGAPPALSAHATATVPTTIRL